MLRMTVTSFFIRRYSRLACLPLPAQVAIVLGCLLPVLWAFIAFDLFRFHARTLAESTKETENLTHLFSEKVQSSIHAIDLTLVSLREHWLEEPEYILSKVRARQTYLEKDVAFHVAILNAEGRLVFSSLEQRAQSIDMSYRDYFKAQRDSPADELVISDPVIGRISKRPSL